MGAELGQEAEWDFAGELRWAEAETPENLALTAFFRDANRFYRETRELWEMDFDPQGFQWLAPDEAERNIVAFLRRDMDGREIAAAFNFSGVRSTGFRLGVPEKGDYTVCFTTDNTLPVNRRLRTRPVPAHGWENSLLLEIPPLSAVFFRKKKKVKPRRITKGAAE